MYNIDPEGPAGFDLLLEQGEGQFVYPSESTPCADLFVPDRPPFVCILYRHAPKFVRTLRSNIRPSVVKEQASQLVVWSL